MTVWHWIALFMLWQVLIYNMLEKCYKELQGIRKQLDAVQHRQKENAS